MRIRRRTAAALCALFLIASAGAAAWRLLQPELRWPFAPFPVTRIALRFNRAPHQKRLGVTAGGVAEVAAGAADAHGFLGCD
jgi:hypothetical protein